MTTSGIRIRKLENRDLEQVALVVQKSMLPSLAKLSPEIIQKKLSRNNTTNFLTGRELVEYFVAERETEILGLVGLQDNEIRTFYVDPTRQGQGIGRLLYNKIIELAKVRNFKELIVKSSEEAFDVYKHLGFIKVNKIWKTTEDGSKHFTILMKQIL